MYLFVSFYRIVYNNQGDSGGPFVCNEGGRWVLRGAVSWGHSMCRTDHYTVFARVSSFIKWIHSKKSGNWFFCNYSIPIRQSCIVVLIAFKWTYI